MAELATKETPVPGRPYSARLVRRLRNKLRALFAEQYADAMDILDREAGRKIIGDLEPDWRSMFTPQKLARWADDVYPEVEEGWRRGSRAGYRDVKAQLDEVNVTLEFPRFDVEAPGARTAIRKAALDLSASANGFTQRNLDKMLPRLRSALIEGTYSGESYPWMAEKIQKLFGHNDKYRAERIAITETQRGIHRGLLEQYRESGVVEATQWLTSGAPCPICEAIQLDSEQGVRLFAEYANDGKGGTYSSVQAPPAHVNCLCSLYPILIPVEQMPKARLAA